MHYSFLISGENPVHGSKENCVLLRATYVVKLGLAIRVLQRFCQKDKN